MDFNYVVYHNLKWLYFIIPKSGSTWFKEVLDSYNGEPGKQVCNNLSASDIFTNYKKVTLIRNPYQRAISAFKFVFIKHRHVDTENQRIFRKILGIPALDNPVILKNQFYSYMLWLDRYLNGYDDYFELHGIPQHLHVDGVEFDLVLRLNEAESYLEKEFGYLPEISRYPTNVDDEIPTHLSDFKNWLMDDALLELVEKNYKKDIEWYGKDITNIW